MNQIKHEGHTLVELAVAGLSFEENIGVIHEFAAWLQTLKAGKQAKVLLNLEGANYDPRVALVWKTYLPLFTERVEKSAVIGVSSLIAAAIHGIASTASLGGKPFKGRRGVIFTSREAALDFLIAP